MALWNGQAVSRLSVYTDAELLLPRFDEEEFLTEMFVGGPPKVSTSLIITVVVLDTLFEGCLRVIICTVLFRILCAPFNVCGSNIIYLGRRQKAVYRLTLRQKALQWLIDQSASRKRPISEDNFLV